MNCCSSKRSPFSLPQNYSASLFFQQSVGALCFLVLWLVPQFVIETEFLFVGRVRISASKERVLAFDAIMSSY
jgi:hypothetical protein